MDIMCWSAMNIDTIKTYHCLISRSNDFIVYFFTFIFLINIRIKPWELVYLLAVIPQGQLLP